MRIRPFLLAAVAAFALGLPGAGAQQAAPFTPEQEARIRELVKDYIIKNPEVIIEAVNEMRRKQELQAQENAKEALQRHRDALIGAKDLPVAGNPNGDVTIVEFIDYRCGYCKAVKPAVDEVLKTDGKIRLVIKEFPILGPNSTLASVAAYAAHRQGKYMAFHEAMMKYKDGIDERVIFDIAKRVGLDVDKLRADMRDPSLKTKIEETHRLARDLNISGTPAFVIGDEIVPGAIGPDEIREKVAAARKLCAENKQTLC
jgi:protein-disulfide isomerase